MAPHSTVIFVQQRVLLLQRSNSVSSLSFATQCSLRHSFIMSDSKCCPLRHTKWKYRAIYFNNNAVSLKLGRHARCESTAGKSTKEDQPSKFQQFKKIIRDFVAGAKELYKDVRKTLIIRRKLKTNNWNYSLLTRQELWTMVRTQKNLKKALPIVLLSCLPFVGYLGPVIGFLRPQQFFTYHFWTEKQKKNFAAADDRKRSEYLHVILKDIKGQVKNHEDYDLMQKLTEKEGQNYDPNNGNLIKILPIFSNGVFKLENLSRMHLQNLCSFWLLSSWLPNLLLQNKLRKEMISIHKDDAAIAREGIKALSSQEVEEACRVRGLNTSHISSEELSKWLQDWVQLSINVPEKDTSFLAHQAIFKTVNYRKRLSETEVSGKG